MKIIIIYTSQTGFTKRYAQWLAEETGADCFSLADAKKMDLSFYDTIVYGGWACAGGISKIHWFASHIDNWAGKKLAAFCVGGSPMENPELEIAIKNHFNEPKLDGIRLFYCPGGFDYEKMPTPSKLMMKMFIKALKSKKDKTEAEEQQIKMLSGSYDISDKKYLAPIVAFINHN